MDRDLGEVYENLINIKHRWYVIGLQLDVETNKLDSIKSQFYQQPDMALLEVLKEWLKQTGKPCTWDVLVKALRTKSVNEEKTAENIEMRYISHTKGMLTDMG